MAQREQRLNILKQVESGAITIEQGSRLLADLEQGLPAMEPQPSRTLPEDEPVAANPVGPVEVFPLDREPSGYPRENYWWLVPVIPGALLTVLAAYWMYLGWQAAGPGWGFWLSWLPMFIGVALIFLGWYLRGAPWLHIRIRQRPGKSPRLIAISIPVPIGLAGWFLRTFRAYIPEQFREQNFDELLEELGRSVNAETPLHIQSDEDGEQVEIYLG